MEDELLLKDFSFATVCFLFSFIVVFLNFLSTGEKLGQHCSNLQLCIAI